MILIYLIMTVAAYLIGSVPFAYLLVRRSSNIDIRSVGSGNVGSTNALRVAGWRVGAAVLAADLLKGAVVVWAARLVGGELPVLLCGLGVLLGHIYPVWLDFQGGKGVAVCGGMALILLPRIAVVALAVWAVLLLASGYVSFSSCVAVCIIPAAALLTAQPWLLSLLFLLCAAVVVVRHRSNIKRLLERTEPRMLHLFPWHQ